MKQDCITTKQLVDLIQLGFKTISLDIHIDYHGKPFLNKNDIECSLMNIPIDLAIDWLRKKYNIMIYNTAPPFVDPMNNKKIKYGYRVKFCNINRGWNFRELIGESQWSHNIYAAKRKALTIAIKHAFEIKERKAKVLKLHRKLTPKRNGSNKKG